MRVLIQKNIILKKKKKGFYFKQFDTFLTEVVIAKFALPAAVCNAECGAISFLKSEHTLVPLVVNDFNARLMS